MNGTEKLLYSLDEEFGPRAGVYLFEFFAGLNPETTIEQLPYWFEGSTYRVERAEDPWVPSVPEEAIAHISVKSDDVKLPMFYFYGWYCRIGYSKVFNTLYYKWLR